MRVLGILLASVLRTVVQAQADEIHMRIFGQPSKEVAFGEALDR